MQDDLFSIPHKIGMEEWKTKNRASTKEIGRFTQRFYRITD